MTANVSVGRLPAMIATAALMGYGAAPPPLAQQGGGGIAAGTYAIHICAESDRCHAASASIAGRLVLLPTTLSRRSLPDDAFIDWWVAFASGPVNGCFLPTQAPARVSSMAAVEKPVALHWQRDPTDSSRVIVSFSLSPDGSYRMGLVADAGARLAGQGDSRRSPPPANPLGSDSVVGEREGPPNSALCEAAARSVVPRRPR